MLGDMVKTGSPSKKILEVLLKRTSRISPALLHASIKNQQDLVFGITLAFPIKLGV